MSSFCVCAFTGMLALHGPHFMHYALGIQFTSSHKTLALILYVTKTNLSGKSPTENKHVKVPFNSECVHFTSPRMTSF